MEVIRYCRSALCVIVGRFPLHAEAVRFDRE